MQGSNQNLLDELATQTISDDRGNRLCVTISDIHLTDGTVGFQNLTPDAWKRFFNDIAESCQENKINEFVLVLDGDVVDLIRSGEWCRVEGQKSVIYPWERERKAEFEKAVHTIIKNIVIQHEYFFERLRNLEATLESECETLKSVDVVILLGNHDKELLLVNDSLAYFYEQALGKKPTDFSEETRRYIGRMYGDETQFLDQDTVPYFPFYFADKGFRFFATHGHWRDAENSRAIKPIAGVPGWSEEDGWRPDVWEKQKYAAFLEPCFGDSVAAGIVSTFIAKTKVDIEGKDKDDESVKRLTRILDELDLYRPSYLAPKRMHEEAKRLRAQGGSKKELAEIIEKNLIFCIDQWLGWEFPHQSASKTVSRILRVAKFVFGFIKMLHLRLELSAIYRLMQVFEYYSHHKKTGVDLDKMKTFPGFNPPFSDNGFQIHGEGHTHNPLQEEARLKEKTNFTYVNFGTWRDRIVGRQDDGYRRQGVLRTFHILDIEPKNKGKDRQFISLAKDVVIWRDTFDNF